MKSIIYTFKHASFNDDLDDRKKLIQEFPTRFRTNQDIVTWFKKPETDVRLIVHQKNGDAAKEIYENLTKFNLEIRGQNLFVNPALEAISACFAPLRHTLKQNSVTITLS